MPKRHKDGSNALTIASSMLHGRFYADTPEAYLHKLREQRCAIRQLSMLTGLSKVQVEKVL